MRIWRTLILFLFFFSALIKGEEAQIDLFSELLKFAEKGDAEAAYHIGMFYHLGINTEKDQSKAFEWFQKAAFLGDPLASYKVGCYYAGQGSEINLNIDLEKALEYKLVAAKAGYALAQADVANLYRFKGDLEKAEYWAVEAQKQISAPTELTQKARMGKKRAVEHLKHLKSLSQN